jgi:hypothetical protein
MIINACSGSGGLLAGFLVNAGDPASYTRLFLLQVSLLVLAGSLVWFRITPRIPRPPRSAAAERRTGTIAPEGEPRRLRRNVGGTDDPFGSYAFRWAFMLGFLYPIFGNQQLFSGLPLHITRIDHRTTRVVGVAFAANTYTIVATQLLAFHLLRGRRRSVIVGAMFTLLVLVWLVVLAADRQSGAIQVGGFALAAALIGLGEVMLTISAPPIPALIAPPEQLGRFVSRFTMSRGVVQVIAPTLAGLLVDPAGGALLPVVMGCCAVASGIYLARAARALPPEVNRI